MIPCTSSENKKGMDSADFGCEMLDDCGETLDVEGIEEVVNAPRPGKRQRAQRAGRKPRSGRPPMPLEKLKDASRWTQRRRKPELMQTLDTLHIQLPEGQEVRCKKGTIVTN